MNLMVLKYIAVTAIYAAAAIILYGNNCDLLWKHYRYGYYRNKWWEPDGHNKN